MIIIYDILGYTGSTLLTVMMYPQVYLTVKTNKIDDLSIRFVSLNLIATFCLIPYSVFYNLIPILIANVSICGCNIILLTLYIKNTYCKKNQVNDDNN